MNLDKNIFFNIVLVEPQIPPNTGNIARLTAGMNCHLHLIQPLGFDIDNKSLRRAGLDYWDQVNLTLYESWSDFDFQTRTERRYFFTSKKGQRYYDIQYQSGDWFVFGSEDYGLDNEILKKYSEQVLTIPMNGKIRCLNLSTSVGMVVGEAMRQMQQLVCNP